MASVAAWNHSFLAGKNLMLVHADKLAMKCNLQNSPPDLKCKQHVQLGVPGLTNKGRSLAVLYHCKRGSQFFFNTFLYFCHSLQPFQYQAFGEHTQIIHKFLCDMEFN